MRPIPRFGGLLLLALAFLAAGGPAAAQERLVDGIAAVVNERIITLVDVQIVEAFGIVEGPIGADLGTARLAILQKLIDRKVVLDLSRGQAPADPARVEAEIVRIAGRLGEEETRARLARFGLSVSDIRPYLEEKLKVEAVIADRFSRSVPVNLDEIEARYRNTYEPGERAAGRTPKPFLEVVDDLENGIRAEKIAVQSALWVQSLRDQAEIEIRPDILKK
ncbi:MAG: hypothetical protein JW843_08725 [Candidatus Aminicenantes bacterium]|nr:hypothetical protein [Candidatus Aminicenantes bacterium]